MNARQKKQTERDFEAKMRKTACFGKLTKRAEKGW